MTVSVLVLLAVGCSGETACKNARDCSGSQRCINRVCRGSAETLGGVGDGCISDAECSAGLTCELAAAFPNGFCTAACTTVSCTTGACADVATGATCAPVCAVDTDCRTGYSCCHSMGSVCVPSAACTPAQCVRPISDSAVPGTQLLPLPSGQLHEVHKVGDTVPFTVPAGTGSITIYHQAQIAGLSVIYQGSEVPNSAVPSIIYQPDGGKAYDDNDKAFFPDASPDGGVDPTGIYGYYGNDSPSTAAFTLPDTSASLSAGIEPGQWKFIVNDYAYECASGAGCTDGGSTTNTYDVMVVAKPAVAPAAPAYLDVAFYIVADTTTLSGQVYNAASAANDPSTQRMLKTFKGIYANAGVTIRNVTFYDVPETAKARFGTHISADLTGPCDELDQMFTLSQGNPGNVLNLFLVQTISSTDQGGGSVVGIDGTIPGPAGLSGTVHSGAAVSLADLFQQASLASCSGAVNISGCGADEVAFIAAHEAGHYLGLFHTTESAGSYFDPLTDTGKCPCIPCASSTDLPKCSTGGTASSPVFMDAVSCVTSATCAGGDNLMFWQLQPPASKGNLSAQQGAIMRASPVVQ